MLVTPASSPPATPASPPRTAPGQALAHQGTEEDDHWHECQEPACSRTLNFGNLDSTDSFPRLISEDVDNGRFVSLTEPAMTPPCSLPMTPKGSRTASPVGAGPTRLVRRWSRVSGYRTPGTADGFVRCWQAPDERKPSEGQASSSRPPRPTLMPPPDLAAQREQALTETKALLAQCVEQLQARAGSLETQQQDVWRPLQSALTRTERLLKHVEADLVLGSVSPKAVVLMFVMEVHIQKKKYRRQTAAALKTLLKSEAWRQAFLQDAELRELSQHPDAQELRAQLPAVPPSLPVLPIATREEEAAHSPLPIFSQPLSARPNVVTSPTRRAAVEADAKVMKERRARRATRRFGEPIEHTLRCCRDQVEALEFAEIGEADEVNVAFETFHRAVRQAFGKTSATDLSKGDVPSANQSDELANFEPKAEMVIFLKNVWAKRKVLRARVSFVLHRLETMDAWKAILDAMPEVQELLHPEAQSPGHPSPVSPDAPFSEPEPEVSSTGRLGDAAEEPSGVYTSFVDHDEEFNAKVRREAPWYLLMCIWLIGVNRTLRFCKCIVPSRIHQEVSYSVSLKTAADLLTAEEKLHVNDVLKASGSPARI